MDKYIGRLLDNRYEILEVIGTGGMAVVYKARCHRLNRLVAVKILKDDYLGDEEFRQRFHSESQAVAMLSHPNIISVYDVSTSITADYIVMELIDGITLKQYMEKKGVLNWKETLHFAIQIAKALEHAHSRGIVHRDIKPHNVMVLKNGSVKVTDFGIARMMSKGNTLTKEALGSVHYISPEQAKGGRVDNRSDLYSLGVVMYEMMSGRAPYDGESPVSVAIQHINGGAAMPSTLNPNIPGGLEQIIMRAMALEPVNRYATATQMLADLDEFRKDPAILFDYNAPTEDVIKVAHPATQEPEKVTAADRAVGKATGEKPAAPVRRRTQPGERRRQNPSQRRQEQDPEEAKKNKITTIAIIACASVLAIAVLIFVFVLVGSSPNVPVPELVGKVYDTLSQEAYEFNIKLDKEIFDDTIPAGTIISQTPEAGEEVVKNGNVYVVVSKGPQMDPVYLPDLKGKDRDAAEKALNDLALKVKIKVELQYNEEFAEGKVISTDPAANTEVTDGQEITLFVSQGMEIKTSTMPSVAGQTLEIAKKILNSQNLNLELEIIEVNHDDVAKGQVIDTVPASGEELKTGQKVTLNVSLGPKLIIMPNVVDMTITGAQSKLTSLGFDPQNVTYEYVNDKAARDTVIGQSVSAQEEVASNTPIVLTVSKGQVQETTKEHTVKVPAGMEGSEVSVINANGSPVGNKMIVPAGATTISVTVKGVGVQEFTAVFNNDEEQVSVPFTVDFDA